MKRTIIHTSAAIALLLGIAACTQDEAGFLQEGAEGTPIVFTATGLNPAATAIANTRSTVDGDWEGVQSVAVLMDGTVKAYDVTLTTADPASATLTSTDPHYWTNRKDITVTAWWPYTAGETTPSAVKVKANQSARKDFEGSDLIVADGQTVTYGSPTLRFTHRTARVTIVLTDYTEGLASVRLTGLSTEGGNPAEITPYDKGSNTYTALVAPQSVVAGTAFITCTFTNGKTFVYKMKNATDWQAIFALSQAMSLFASRQTLLLILPENGPNAAINEQLATLVGLLHDDLLLIVRGNKLTKAQENAVWLTALAQRAVQVSCQTPEYAQLPRWLAARAKQHQLQLDDAASQLLCYCYEGNLLALAQALERLALLWPDGKLTLPRVEQAVNDAAHFTPYHWVDALLAGKSKRVLHVLQQLRLEGCEPAILLRTLQRELLLLVTLKRQATHTPLRSLFDKHRVWQNRRQLLSDALTRLSGEQLRQAVTLLTRAELTFKQDYGHDVWPELESLSLLLCHKALADVFIDG